MGLTTSIVGRLQCVHPDLGHDGGVTLEGHVKSTLTKISDAINSRFFISRDLANGASVHFEHNFKCNFDQLRILLFNIDGSDELTRITKGGTPDLDDFTIVAKVGSTTTHITVTNGTGSEQDIALILIQGKGAEVLNDLSDVDTTGKEDGQALVYNGSKFVPGASGDSSFKFQSINSGGTALVIKGGAIRLNDGRILYAASDLTDDVSGKANSDGDWSGFIDLYTLGSSSIVAHRRVYTITTANFVYFKNYADDTTIDLSRYIPCGNFDRTSGVYSGLTTFPMRPYDLPIGSDSSLVDFLDWTLIGAVGDAGQLNSGHQLASSSFPSTAIGANLSWYNLPDENDDSGNARTLTNNNSVTFGTGILGDASQSASLNGSNQSLSSLNTLFDPDDLDWCAGGWFKPTSWAPGAIKVLFSQWVGGGNNSFEVYINAANLLCVNGSTTGSDSQNVINVDVSSLTGWHHIACKYVASSNLFILYVDGINVGEGSLSTNLRAAGSTRNFIIGADTGNYFGGQIDEFFFCVGTLTDNDIMKIQAAKYAHNKGLASNAQNWLWFVKTATDAERPIDNNPVIAQTVNELFFDLSQEDSAAYVSRKLFSAGQSGQSKPVRGQTLQLTTDALDAMLPLSHGLGVVPVLYFSVSDGTDYNPESAKEVFKCDSSQIKLFSDTLVNLFGSGVSVILTYASGIPVSFVPNKFWNVYKATANRAIGANDKCYADPSGGSFSLTIPGSASLGDGMIVEDYKANFSPSNKVTLSRNGHNINGVADDFDLDTPGRVWHIDYIDASYGFAVR